MNQSIMRKSALSSAIVLSLVASDTFAATPDPITINNMLFGVTNFAANGTLNMAGGGAMNSVDPFFYHTWTATQETVFLDNTDTWSGSSLQGAYDYDANIAAMTVDQVAVGIFFNWNGNNEIAVLEIFDCDTDSNCQGVGVPMVNGPFGGPAPTGSVAIFSGGPLPMTCDNASITAEVNAPAAIAIADIVATCENALSAVSVTDFDATTSNGGAIINDGTSIVYTPRDGFEGPDSFEVSLNDSRATSAVIEISVQIGGELQNNFTMMGAAGGTFGGTNDVVFEWDGAYNSNAIDGEGILTATDFDSHVSIGSPNPFLNFTWTAHHIRIFQGPGTFKFDVTCEALADYDNGLVSCDKNLALQGASTRFMTMTLEADEIGGHMLFDWGSDSDTSDCGKANCDIDVVQTWKENEMWNGYEDASPRNDLWIGAAGVVPASDENSTVAANWELVSTDVKGYTDIAGVVHADGNEINGAPMLDGAFVDNYANFNKTPDRVGTSPEPITSEIKEVSTSGFSFSIWTLMAGLFSVFGLRKVNRSK